MFIIFLFVVLFFISHAGYLKMLDQQILMHFFQEDSELFYCAWDRYKELLFRFSNHGFPRECQLLNFLDGLQVATRTWVEGRNSTSYFYDLNADEVLWSLEEKADFDY